MPLFNRKTVQKNKDDQVAVQNKHNEHDDQVKQNLVFHCQQAHGSPTGLVSNFSNVRELYQRVADCYDFPSDEVSSIQTYLIIPSINCNRASSLSCNFLNIAVRNTLLLFLILSSRWRTSRIQHITLYT